MISALFLAAVLHPAPGLVPGRGAPQEPAAAAPAARQILWQRNLEDALAIAKAEDRPLFIAVNMDGESASDRIVNERYRDPAFVAATRECVCLVASVFRHSPRDHDERGRRIPCPRLGEVTCGEHMALEPLLFEHYLADGERVAPRHAVILQNGEKAWDLSLCFDLHDIDRALFATASAEAQRRLQAGLVDGPATVADASWAQLAELRDNRGRARLEAAFGRIPDELTLGTALGALARHGDAGSLDALRVVSADLPRLSERARDHVVATARALGLEAPLAVVLRQALQAPDAIPAEPGPAGREVLLPVLAGLDGDSASTRSFLLACRALAEYGPAADGALQRALGPDAGAAIDAAVVAGGGPVSLSEVFRRASAAARRAGESTLPLKGEISDAMPQAHELESELEELDAELESRGDDPELLARYAKALLDLARRRIESQGSGAQVLLEDAERHFGLALDRDPSRAEWWIERARAAYFLQRFGDEVEYGRRAFALLDDAPGGALAIEALRWVGDGDARLLWERAGKDPSVEITGIQEGLRALGSVAASPYGDGTDWVSFASFCGALGLLREELAVAARGVERLPTSAELRQCLNGALWNAGRIDLAPIVAEEVASRNAPSAQVSWYSGYAWILGAEEHRRSEACEPALLAYDRAEARFEEAADRDPDLAASCAYYVALAWLGRGMAHVRLGQRQAAADCLIAAVSRHADLTEARDGLGYDVLDLIDKVLEWRESGPSPVDPLDLLDRLEAAAPGQAFWAAAVSDSELREALRADGRNPDRAERDTVDAAGKPIRMLMGLPWAEGDGYLEASIAAGRRALPTARSEEDRKPLAQACTIAAERQLELGRLDGVREALAEAAPLVGLDAPPPDADEGALRDLARRLRAVLGEARPRFRPGR